jgi:glycine/D-amino acid oxidase-like deaminating enzyme
MNVVVIGAGIVGAALADRLAATGARITVVDAAAPGRGTSAMSLAWLNANATLDPGYFGFRVAAMRAWAELAAEFGEPPWYVPTGNLVWTRTDETREELAGRVDRLRDRDYPARLVTAAEAAAIEPGLRAPPTGALAAHFPAEGYVHGAEVVQVLLGRAQRAGARLIAGSRVTGLEVGGGRVTGVRLSTGQRLAADAVVCAAGWRANALLATLDAELPLADVYEPGSPAPGVIVTVAAPGSSPRGIVHAPAVHVRAAWPDGLLMLPGDGGTAIDMFTTEAELIAQAADLLGHAAQILVGLGGARITAAWRCVRPLPADGYPLVGWHRPGLYVAVTHSGITLAPYLARLITEELLAGADAPELASYRPDRPVAGPEVGVAQGGRA